MYHSSFNELKENFDNMINSLCSELGLAPNEIKSNRTKPKSPFVNIKYRPLKDKQIYGGKPYHKMQIYVVISTEYKKDVNPLDIALSKAAIIEMACLIDGGFFYDGHEEYVTIDMLETEKQSDYILVSECYAYYRNV